MNNSYQTEKEQATLVELNDQALAEVAGALGHTEHVGGFGRFGRFHHINHFGHFGGCCGLQVDPCCYGGDWQFYRRAWLENSGCCCC